MTSAGAYGLAYDPMMRLYQLEGSGTEVRFAYDGAEMVAEYDGSGNLLRRHVFGPGIDEPLVTYEGSGTSDRRFLHADERGSIVAHSNFWGNGQVTVVNRYDEYGVPQSTNSGRFGYTGQAWLPEIGLYYYRARMYNPGPATGDGAGGRFMQTDPIGYDDGPNMYAYVGGDPVNSTDPTGMFCTGSRIPCPPRADGSGGGIGPGLSGSSGYIVGAEGGVPLFGGYFRQVRKPGPASQVGDTIIATSAFLWVPPQFSLASFGSLSLASNWRPGHSRPGGPINAPQVCLRGCHSIETPPGDRYTTEAENEQLVEIAAALFPWVRFTKVFAAARGIERWLGPGIRGGRTRDGNYWFQSADGQRQVRIDMNPPRQGRWGGAHIQFEVRNARGTFRPAPGFPRHIYFRPGG